MSAKEDHLVYFLRCHHFTPPFHLSLAGQGHLSYPFLTATLFLSTTHTPCRFIRATLWFFFRERLFYCVSSMEKQSFGRYFSPPMDTGFSAKQCFLRWSSNLCPGSQQTLHTIPCSVVEIGIIKETAAFDILVIKFTQRLPVNYSNQTSRIVHRLILWNIPSNIIFFILFVSRIELTLILWRRPWQSLVLENKGLCLVKTMNLTISARLQINGRLSGRVSISRGGSDKGTVCPILGPIHVIYSEAMVRVILQCKLLSRRPAPGPDSL